MTLPQRLNGSVAEAPKGAVLWEVFHPVCLLFSFFLVVVVSALAEPNGEISARVKSALADLGTFACADAKELPSCVEKRCWAYKPKGIIKGKTQLL